MLPALLQPASLELHVPCHRWRLRWVTTRPLSIAHTFRSSGVTVSRTRHSGCNQQHASRCQPLVQLDEKRPCQENHALFGLGARFGAGGAWASQRLCGRHRTAAWR